jgi:hypothetical protein
VRDQPTHSQGIRGFRRWLESWRPSARVGRDPLAGFRVDGRYAPVSIANWKLTPRMKRVLLGHRSPRSLSFDADKRLTVVIPFRDRDEHLRELMPALTTALAAQHVTYRVVVVEQLSGGFFNRGRLINAGVLHAAAETDYYCLHDVDAVPLAANYQCPSLPLRLVHTIRNLEGESRRSEHYFSGVVSIRKEQVFAANGYPNEYWGWGKEDDDFFFRLLLADLLCFYDTQGVFRDLPNPKGQQVDRKGSGMPGYVRRNRRRRSHLVRGIASPLEDGLNTLRFEVMARVHHGAYEQIRVRW